MKPIGFSQFYDESGLYRDYHVGGNYDIEMSNVWGKPFNFTVKGRDKTAAFSAWLIIAGDIDDNSDDNSMDVNSPLYVEWILDSLAMHLCFSTSQIEFSYRLRKQFWKEELTRFKIFSDKNYFDATNDAMVAAVLLQNCKHCFYKQEQNDNEEIKKERETILQYYDALASLIDDNGHLSCCMIDGKVYNEMYSRHGLVVASLVYAYKILGKELYAEKAKKLADYFIAHNYHKEGYFDNWISIGTDSEICTGLLEVYDITGDKKYLNICEQVAKYYDSPHAKMTHDPRGHEDLRHKQHIYSTVDQAEFVILLKNLYAFTKNKHYLVMARGILKDLDRCYDPKWKLYSHMCYWNGKHDDHFFAVIQAIIYIAML